MIDRYGIPPELIPDFYGLKGDTSDNIPGVPGIGDKTASDLLQRFGDLETVLASIDEISGAKRKENLTNHADDARMSKELATIQTDVPVEIDVAECYAAEPDRSAIRETFRVFELRDPLRRLEEALGEDEAGAPAPSATTIEVRAVKVAPAGLSQLDGELAALAAERPQAGGAGSGRAAARRAGRGAAAIRRVRGRRRDGRRGRDARRGDDGLGRAAAGRPRLEVDRRRRRSPARRRRSSTTRSSPPTCSIRRAAPIRSTSCSRTRASASP